MSGEDKRFFKRYVSDAECEVKIGSGTYKGALTDYSADGVCIVVKNPPELMSGAEIEISVIDKDLSFQGEIIWVKDAEADKMVGLRRLDVLRGALAFYQLADLLIGLQRSTKTGILEIRSGSITKNIYFQDGDMVFATSNNVDDRLGELLVKEGKITLEEYTQASNLLMKTGQRLGKIFVELGLYTPSELFNEVKHQIEEIILSLFTLEEGKFEFYEGSLPEEEVLTLQINAANIIFQGIKRITNFTHLRQMCPPPEIVLNLSPDPLHIFQHISVEEIDKKVLSYVNGMYSIKTILSLSPATNFETLKILCGFQSIGIIKEKAPDEAPVVISVEDILLQPEEEAPAEFLEKIEEIYQKCQKLNYYEVLGVDKNAPIQEITKAYYRISKQFHPDRHFSFETQGVKEKLMKILSYTTEAYDILSHSARRMEYNMSLSLRVLEKEKASHVDSIPVPDTGTAAEPALSEEADITLPREGTPAPEEIPVVEQFAADQALSQNEEGPEMPDKLPDIGLEDINKEPDIPDISSVPAAEADTFIPGDQPAEDNEEPLPDQLDGAIVLEDMDASALGGAGEEPMGGGEGVQIPERETPALQEEKAEDTTDVPVVQDERSAVPKDIPKEVTVPSDMHEDVQSGEAVVPESMAAVPEEVSVVQEEGGAVPQEAAEEVRKEKEPVKKEVKTKDTGEKPVVVTAYAARDKNTAERVHSPKKSIAYILGSLAIATVIAAALFFGVYKDLQKEQDVQKADETSLESPVRTAPDQQPVFLPPREGFPSFREDILGE